MTKQTIENAKVRLFKNYATTGLGLLFMVGAGITGYMGNMERASFLGGYAVMFLRSKDSLIGLAAK